MKLNFGCGTDIKEGWDNVDMQKSPKVTQSFDFDIFPYPLKENFYEHVFMSQVLEHVLYPDRTLIELHKACKNGATIEISVPHYTNKGAYNDMQHLHYFNENAFKSFVEDESMFNNRKFKIIELIITPTKIGKIFPKALRNKISLFINGLQSQIHCIYEVIK